MRRYIEETYYEDGDQYRATEMVIQDAINYVRNLGKSSACKKRYEKELKLAQAGWTVRPHFKLFVKKEITMGTDAIPRAIQPMDDTTRNLSSVVYKLVEKQVYHHPDFIKLIPGDQRSKYVIDKLQDYKYIMECDFSKFDSTQRDIHLAVETELVKKICPILLPIWRATTQADVPTEIGRARQIVAWSIKTRKSGECMTALGNAFINWSGFYSATQHYGIKAGGIFEGDDSLIGANSIEDLETIASVYRAMGFEVKASIRPGLDGAVFCKQIFAKLTTTYATYRDPATAIMKLGWSKMSRGDPFKKASQSYLVTKLSSIDAEYRGYSAMHRLTAAIRRKVDTRAYIRHYAEQDHYIKWY